MLEDAQIIQLYWDRDMSAISETDVKYGKYCTKIAMNILSSGCDAEECVNDTYHKTWDTIPPQRPEVFPPFLGKIVRNLALDRYRYHTAQKRNGKMDVLLSELEHCLPVAESVEDAMDASVVSDVINRYLEGLSRQKRVIFVQRYWYGAQVREIAQTLGLREKTVSARLRRLRDRLQKSLKKEGFHYGSE